MLVTIRWAKKITFPFSYFVPPSYSHSPSNMKYPRRCSVTESTLRAALVFIKECGEFDDEDTQQDDEFNPAHMPQAVIPSRALHGDNLGIPSSAFQSLMISSRVTNVSPSKCNLEMASPKNEHCVRRKKQVVKQEFPRCGNTTFQIKKCRRPSS